MKIKKFNENEEAKKFVCEYIRNIDNTTFVDYFEFFFENVKLEVKTELIKDIKALCSNLGLDANEL